MPVSACPNCDKKLKTPDDAEGRKIRCPGCQTMLVITEDGLEEEARKGVKKAAAGPARKRVDDDDEDQPRSKRRRDDDDEEDDEPRSKRRSRDDDDEDDDDDDDDRPRKKKKKKGGIPLWVWLASGGGGVAVIVLILVLFVFGGGGDFGKIKEGMSEDEVIKILGQPNVSFKMNGKLQGGRWLKPEASAPKEAIDVSFENGKVKKKERFTGKDMEKPPHWTPK
jgi:hypothetical protein